MCIDVGACSVHVGADICDSAVINITTAMGTTTHLSGYSSIATFECLLGQNAFLPIYCLVLSAIYDTVCACSCNHHCYKLGVLRGGVSACDRYHGSINQKPSIDKARSVYLVAIVLHSLHCSGLMHVLTSFVK